MNLHKMKLVLVVVWNKSAGVSLCFQQWYGRASLAADCPF